MSDGTKEDRAKRAVIEALRKHSENRGTATGSAPPQPPAMFKEEEEVIPKPNQMLISERLKELGVKLRIPKQYDCLVTVHPDEEFEDWGAYIPEYDVNYIWEPSFLYDMIMGLEMGDNIFIGGPTGTGKTMASRNLAAIRNKPWFRISGREDMTNDDMIGNMAVKQGEDGVETPFILGPLPEAMLAGADLCVDEPTQIPPAIAMSLQAPLEGMPLLITLGNDDFKDRQVVPSENFRIICCDNTTGTGDETGLYGGCKVWNIATLDRFGTAVWLDYLKKRDELRMLKGIFPELTDELAGKLLTFAASIRKGHVEGDLQLTLSARSLINITKKALCYRDPARAVRLGLFNKFGNDAEKQAVSSFFYDAFAVNL